MQTIHKFTLEIAEEQVVAIPGLVTVLSVIEQNNKLVLYAIVNDNPNGFVYDLRVSILGTGNSFDADKVLGKGLQNNFLGSHKINHFVWHVWYKL